jgi:hypothetical protein
MLQKSIDVAIDAIVARLLILYVERGNSVRDHRNMIAHAPIPHGTAASPHHP